jgi:hypothetical protein
LLVEIETRTRPALPIQMALAASTYHDPFTADGAHFWRKHGVGFEKPSISMGLYEGNRLVGSAMVQRRRFRIDTSPHGIDPQKLVFGYAFSAVLSVLYFEPLKSDSKWLRVALPRSERICTFADPDNGHCRVPHARRSPPACDQPPPRGLIGSRPSCLP